MPIGEGISLKARAYEALKSAILNMNIYADEAELRLDERDLSQRFGVSRTPLREALAQLDQEGLVRIVARRGIFIVRKTKRSEEHTSELQSLRHLVCRLLLEKKDQRPTRTERRPAGAWRRRSPSRNPPRSTPTASRTPSGHVAGPSPAPTRTNTTCTGTRSRS